MPRRLQLAGALGLAVVAVAATVLLWPEARRSPPPPQAAPSPGSAVPDPASFAPQARTRLGAGVYAAAISKHTNPVSPPTADRRHVLIRFSRSATAAQKDEIIHASGGRVVKVIGPDHTYVIAVPAEKSVGDMLKIFAAQAEVALVEPNLMLRIVATPNDTFFPGNVRASADLWGLQNTGQNGGTPGADIHAPQGWDLAGIGAGATPWPPAAGLTVGVVDTGVDASHPDLAGRVITDCFSALTGAGTLASGCADDHGHGTHVSGTIAAIGNNGIGVTGVAPNARVLMCKALAANGSGWTSDIAACVNDIVARSAALGIHVISLSLGGPASSVLQSAVDLAASKGILVAAAAGNDGNATVQYPAGYDGAVSVAATDRNDAHASFSNINDKVEVGAPGVDIVSTVPASVAAGGYGVWSGTSMATPHVAAVAALVSWKRGLVGSALRSAIDAATDDLGPPGRDATFGYGRINLCKAMGGCGAGTGATPSPTAGPTPTPSPTPSPGTGATPTPAPTAAPTPVPVEKGTLTGRAYRSGTVRSGVIVSYSGPAKGSVRTSSTGGYTVSLPPGTYKVTATYGGRSCRAGGSSGPTSVSAGVTSGATTTVYWYC